LGATPGRVFALTFRESLALIATGVGAGLLLALASARFGAEILYGVSPYHASTYLAAAALLAATGALASYVPALRATRLDPVRALQQE
ncbi:MAG TPA: hypothetical protein DEH78_07680, partial [Solibacterales bacterium]|nr:hypothetical protein [Bryobacterales bacterium]